MSIEFDDFRTFLPKYLSASSQQELFNNLRDFPNNIDARFYSTIATSDMELFQGDLVEGLEWYDFESRGIRTVKGIVLGNTCDMSPANKRRVPPHIAFSPLWSLQKYEQSLKANCHSSTHPNIDSHIEMVKQQKVSNYVFLPSIGSCGEMFARLDILQSLPTTVFPVERLVSDRISSLSSYGFYLFIFKISVHFSRIQEGIDRGAGEG